MISVVVWLCLASKVSGQVTTPRTPEDSICRKIARHDTLFHQLVAGSRHQQIDAVKTAKKQEKSITPPLIYAMAYALYQNGREKEAVYWYVIASVRARKDVALIRESLTHYGQKLITLYDEELGRPIKMYILKHPDICENTVRKAFQAEQKTKVAYDRHWPFCDLNFQKKDRTFFKRLLKPKQQWESVSREVTDRYRQKVSRKWFGIDP